MMGQDHTDLGNKQAKLQYHTQTKETNEQSYNIYLQEELSMLKMMTQERHTEPQRIRGVIKGKILPQDQ